MPRRRPPREGPVVHNLIRFAAAVLFIPWLVDAQQQQRPAVPQRHHSPHEGLDAEAVPTFDPRTASTPLETPTSERRKRTLSVEHNSIERRVQYDASAIATLAPADTAVAAPPARRSSGFSNPGLASPQTARSLEDWEVEDFVLLATVDGVLHARDRKTGTQMWEVEMERPMVETTHHRRNRSSVEETYDPASIDDYLWIVEPNRDGSLYIYRPGGPSPGLVDTGLTMKKLVEVCPYSNDDPPVMYSGMKETTLYTVDAKSGKVLKWFGSTRSEKNDESCANPKGLLDSDIAKLPKNATLTLGRTDYTVGIAGKDGHAIATLKFSEWSPNNYDEDLQRQYHKTLDNKYIYTSHDGGVIGIDHDRTSASEPGKLFKHKLSSPVVRVFDVARPWGTERTDPELIILPQPLPPDVFGDEVSTQRAQHSIFLQHTADGSWFAMSGKEYPLAVQGPRIAQCNRQDWRHQGLPWGIMNNEQMSEALVGLHPLDNMMNTGLLTISPPSSDKDNESETLLPDTSAAQVEEPTIPQRIKQLPWIFVNSVLEFIKNPVLILVLMAIVLSNQRQIRAWVGRHGAGKESFSIAKAPVALETESFDMLPEIPENKVAKIAIDQEASESAIPVDVDTTANADTAVKESLSDTPDAAVADRANNQEGTGKKKAHRGRRGGVKHRKGRGSSQDPSRDGPNASQGGSQDGSTTPKPPLTIEDAVRDAQKLGQQTKLEPDIRTIPNDPSEVSGPIIRVGALVVNTDDLIGTGSNGTMVFRGQFDGRDVAVKRMLIQFFDIASQETKLLRESDDHPNVIRYFAQQQAAGFLYIALELCPASLADVIEKPHLHRELAQGGEKDLPNVLYQITNGLQHLHNLRIVHRDLKPQNILVSMGKDGRPRLLVSDFGLCKKLEGEQSSFRATTAHAAGTSGWRAPELLLDDDAKEGTTMVDASTDGNSGSQLISAELMPNRRATRAIDIFSLGLVFFYVLTKGSHPFDCGDRYMREVNIRKGNYNLRLLEVLGDYAFEATDLISSMLAPEPKLRPQARQVMAHPFFWSAKKRLNFLCDVSDHFEKEKRDPPSPPLVELERCAAEVCRGDFLKYLGKEFVDSMGKQRKYTGTRLLDLLRALRNKRNHYEDMSDKLKKDVGPLPEGYLSFWTRKFPNLLITCWNVVYEVRWEETDRFREYYLPAGV